MPSQGTTWFSQKQKSGEKEFPWILRRPQKSPKTIQKESQKSAPRFQQMKKWFFWDSFGTLLGLLRNFQGGAAAFSRRPSLEVEEKFQKSTKRVPKESFFICWNLGALFWDSFLIGLGLVWGRINIHGSTFWTDFWFWLNQVFPWEGTLWYMYIWQFLFCFLA